MAKDTFAPRRVKVFSSLAFGETIKRRRMSQHITLNEMSRRTGFAVSTLSELEKGMKLTFPKASAVCEALGVRLSALIAVSEGSDLPPPSSGRASG